MTSMKLTYVRAHKNYLHVHDIYLPLLVSITRYTKTKNLKPLKEIKARFIRRYSIPRGTNQFLTEMPRYTKIKTISTITGIIVSSQPREPYWKSAGTWTSHNTTEFPETNLFAMRKNRNPANPQAKKRSLKRNQSHSMTFCHLQAVLVGGRG